MQLSRYGKNIFWCGVVLCFVSELQLYFKHWLPLWLATMMNGLFLYGAIKKE